MNVMVKISSTEKECAAWDDYVCSHPEANIYQLSGWKNVIRKTYGHAIYLLTTLHHGNIVGILPIVHMKHFLFGKKLVSIPFFDMGGILADFPEAESALTAEAIKLGRNLGVDQIELRHTLQKPIIEDENYSGVNVHTQHQKVRMILSLPASSETLMASFKSKLRSQIKRPIKEELYARIGGLELIDDFYSVFSINMRDLGSPVHSKAMVVNVLEEFSEKARIVMVYKEETAVACSLIVGFKNILANPWASSLKDFSKLSPNMLLYWTMLEYACDNGYKKFDFGRSTPGEGTYRFKTQWGAVPAHLHWHTLCLNGKPEGHTEQNEKSKFDKAIQYWQKLPVPISKALGPMLRKHISL